MTTRDLRAIERQIQDLKSENAALKRSLIHVSTGGKLDVVTGAALPFPRVCLSVAGLGLVHPRTAAEILCDEDSEVSAYAIAEECFRVLREFRVPLSGGVDNPGGMDLSRVHGDLKPLIVDVVNIWCRCGASMTLPVSEWRQHSEAFQVLKNHGHAGTRSLLVV